MFHCIPCRNPCRHTIHLTFTHILRWSPKRSVKLELGPVAPPFPPTRVCEMYWSRALSLSHVWSGPYTWPATCFHNESVNKYEWPLNNESAGLQGGPWIWCSGAQNTHISNMKIWILRIEHSCGKPKTWNGEQGALKEGRHNTHKHFPTWSMGLWNYASPPSLGLVSMEAARPPYSRGNVCGFHLVA
jgi:hypothetical protein